MRRLTRTDKLRIEIMARDHYPVQVIADTIGVHFTTIYRELKRGAYTHTNSDLTTETRYSADASDVRYQKLMAKREYNLKIGNDHKFARYIENSISKDGYSPAAALARIARDGLYFRTHVCLRTVYNWIDKGVFINITNKDLPMRGRRKRIYRKVYPLRAPRGESIEKRPAEIGERNTFGHWEMDSVVSSKSNRSLLVLTERLTRMELIRLLPDKTSGSVVRALDEMERTMPYFRRIFRSITCDNGTEFSDAKGMEQGGRTKLYYCHPYCSYERGSNETANKLIRRHVPKRSNFDNLTEEKVQAIEDWINDYPRKILGFATARELFQKEVRKLHLLC